MMGQEWADAMNDPLHPVREEFENLSLPELARVRQVLAKLGCISGANLVSLRTEKILRALDEIRSELAQARWGPNYSYEVLVAFENPEWRTNYARRTLGGDRIDGLAAPHPNCRCATVQISNFTITDE